MQFYTIGVYGSTEEEYFKKLQNHNIDLFCDIRQRRGVRGKKYSFVNSIKLQNKLKELNIHYLHIKELAPTKEIRNKQKEDDKQKNILKRDRHILGNTFINEYNNCILKNYDFDNLLSYIEKNNYNNIVFFVSKKNLMLVIEV
jgi:uncharacterized protein (DUF488 family)